MPWRDALRLCAGDEPVSSTSFNLCAQDFLIFMPWNRIRHVLDIGAGMGFMSCDIAAYADSVISLEAVPEHGENFKFERAKITSRSFRSLRAPWSFRSLRRPSIS